MNIRRALAITVAVEAAVSLSLVYSFHIAADGFGAEGLGKWIIIRRLIGVAIPVVTGGMDVALSRYVAMETGSAGKRLVWPALVVVSIGTSVVVGLLFATPSYWARLFFGSTGLVDLVFGFAALTATYSVYVLCFGMRRGEMRMAEANMLYLWSFGVAPLIALGFVQSRIEYAIFALAALVALPVLTVLYSELRRSAPSSRSWRADVQMLVQYGSSRMLSSVGLMALALMPPLLTLQSSGLANAGVVGFGLTLIGLAASIITPLAWNLLPLVARWVAERRFDLVRKALLRIEVILIPTYLVSLPILWWLCPKVANLVLGDQGSTAVLVIQISIIGAGPYAIYVIYKAVLDAISEKGRALQCSLSAAAAFFVVWWAMRHLAMFEPGTNSIMAYAIAMHVLAATSTLFLRKDLRLIERSSGVE